jgi:hypothetical protein
VIVFVLWYNVIEIGVFEIRVFEIRRASCSADFISSSPAAELMFGTRTYGGLN